MSKVGIRIEGMDKVQAALAKFPAEIRRYTQAAGKEIGEEILETRGLRQYPPSGPGNAPPEPYYIRGVGTQADGRNRYNSEKLGTQYYVESGPGYVRIGNRASYARHVVGEEQASHMAIIGWRRMIDVAQEKVDKLARIYQAWIDRLIRDLGL